MSCFDDGKLTRERLINRYIRAMETGHADTFAEILELAIDDSELAKDIDEIDDAYAEELGMD